MIPLYVNSRHIRPFDIRLLVHESDSLQVRCDSRDELSSAHSQCEKIVKIRCAVARKPKLSMNRGRASSKDFRTSKSILWLSLSSIHTALCLFLLLFHHGDISNKSWFASSLSFSWWNEQKSCSFKRTALSFLKNDDSIGMRWDPEKKRELESEGENIVQ